MGQMIGDLTEAEARAIMRRLGKAEGELAATLAIPLNWVIREEAGHLRARNGTAFVMSTGERVFGVTAHHVLEGWRTDRERHNVVGLQLGDQPFEPEGRHAIIAERPDIDLATFQFTREEVRRTGPGKTVLEGYQSQWPPVPPEQGRGIYFAGFPGVEKIWLSRSEISFGAAYAGGIASSVSELDVSSLIERDWIMPVEGGPPLPPENYDFQGISGGPMLTVIHYKGLLRTWALAGVIYQGPNTESDPDRAIPGLEIIKARRAHFILPDGSLDVSRWDSLQSFR